MNPVTHSHYAALIVCTHCLVTGSCPLDKKEQPEWKER